MSEKEDSNFAPEGVSPEAQKQQAAHVEQLLQARANRSPLFDKSVSELRAIAIS